MDTFEAFYREHIRLVHELMSTRVDDAGLAEDFTQDTFLRAWRHFDELRALALPAQRAWLVSTARNLATDAWRRREPVTKATSLERPTGRGPEPELIALRLDVAQALMSLEKSDREMVVLRYVEEMNSREIGELLDMPEGTVRRRLARCRELLGRLLRQWAREGVLL